MNTPVHTAASVHHLFDVEAVSRVVMRRFSMSTLCMSTSLFEVRRQL